MSSQVTEHESSERPRRPAFGPRTAAAAQLVVFACLFAFAVASIAAQTPGGVSRIGLGPEVLIAGWVVVFAALAALYSYDRRQRSAPSIAATRGDEAEPAEAGAAPARVQIEARERPRPLEALLRKKPAPRAGPLRIASDPSPAPAAPVADEMQADVLPEPEPDASPEAEPVVTAEPSPEPRGALLRATALRAEGRVDEAAAAAREGLAGGDDPGPLLLELSHAALARGRVERAIDTARDAIFVWRSRESVAHLIRLLTQTRRFGPADGAMLRRAVARHPEQALLRHALGVFESMHGDLHTAQAELLAALELEADREARRVIERDLAYAREAIARALRAAQV